VHEIMTQITDDHALLEDDMRRIGGHLAKIYCDALRHSEAHRGDSHFGTEAASSVRETAA
jgi:hypothetical protein